MKRIVTALLLALGAPLSQMRLALVLWLARLLPILLVFGLPLFEQMAARSAHHPDARLLIEPAADSSGFAYAWTSDFFRDAVPGLSDSVFWLLVFVWLLTTVLAGGITARLVHGAGGLVPSPFSLECGRFAGRFVRLALLAAFLFYCADFACNSLLASHHEEAAAMHHTQDYELEKGWVRGVLFLALVHLVGVVHAYARIDIVAHDRRSSFLSFLRGLGVLVARLPILLLLELGLLALAAGGALLAWVVMKGASPLHPDASWLAIGTFLLFALLASYIRTALEVGAMVARCYLIVPPSDETIVSQIETMLPSHGDQDEDLPPIPAPA